MVVAAALLSILAVQRYRNYYGGRFDLGNMVQAVYNTAHGHFLQVTTADGAGRQMSRLGAHVDPILAVFASPGWSGRAPMMLLVAQAVIVSLSAWPAYRLGLRVLGDAARRLPAVVRAPALPAAPVRRAERVPPRDPGHPPPAVRLRLRRRGALVAGRAVPRAGRPVQRGDPARDRRHGPLLRLAQRSRGGRSCSPPARPPTSWSRSRSCCPTTAPGGSPFLESLRRPRLERERRGRQRRAQAGRDPGPSLRQVEPALPAASSCGRSASPRC